MAVVVAGERRLLPGVEDGGVSIRYASNEMCVASIGNSLSCRLLHLNSAACDYDAFFSAGLCF